MRARIAYINYTKKLRIFNIINLFCVVYMNQNDMDSKHYGIRGAQLSRAYIKLSRAHVKGITCAREVITRARETFQFFFHHIPLGAP